MRSILLRVLLLFTSFPIFLSCAVKEAPSGGPEDTTKPTILSVNPEPQSTNIPADTKFHLVFSKPMNREKTISAVFLSPVFWDYPEYKWKGKELIITPPEKLAENKTYVLTVGADATGHHGNQMGTSFSYAFSTGSAIDSGSIAGSVYLEGGRASTYDIWAYSYDPTDTAVFLADIPQYATQVDSMNEFEITNIAAGEYIVVAVDDKNDDLFWDPTSETIGLPPSIISLGSEERFEGIVLRPERRDTVQAEISRVKPIDNRKIIVEFSQPILEEISLDTSHFRILAGDSTTLSIEGAYIGSEGNTIFETAEQEAEKSYWLKPAILYSLWGNSFDTSGARFTGSRETDTVIPTLVSSDPPSGSRTTYQNGAMELLFSERIRAFGFVNSVIVIADSLDTLNFLPKWVSPNKVLLEFGTGIPREKKIEVQLEQSEIRDIAGNAMGDSVLSISFRLPPADTVGSVTIPTNKTGNLIGELLPKTGGMKKEISGADRTGTFDFETVFPGIYYFRYFNDADSNGVWSSGTIIPFQPAEWFYFYRDSLVVRSRWTTNIED